MLAFAMLVVVVYRTLIAGGLSQAAAVREMTALLRHGLLGDAEG